MAPERALPTEADALDIIPPSLLLVREKNKTLYGLRKVDEEKFVSGCIELYMGEAAPSRAKAEGDIDPFSVLLGRIFQKASELASE